MTEKREVAQTVFRGALNGCAHVDIGQLQLPKIKSKSIIYHMLVTS